ncbi:MAG: transposase [Spirochaetaceae bacterium]|nr:transposase [Spirochaetaceae bacterium]
MKKLFLTVIEEAKTSKDFKFKLRNCCIMDNHFHFLITP